MICRICHQDKRETDFYIRQSGKPRSECRPCLNLQHRKSYYKRRAILIQKAKQWCNENPRRVFANYLRRQFGVQISDYERIYMIQGGVCAICAKPESVQDRRTGRVRRLHVDHDHSTGSVRGLLCSSCNVGIGHLGEDLDILKSAIRYLEKARSSLLLVADE